MKKFLSIILCTMLIVCLMSCDIDNFNDGGFYDDGEIIEEDTRSKAQFECGKKAYDELVTASDICSDLCANIYDAWHFAIYADDYSYSAYLNGTVLSDFMSKTNLTMSDMDKVAEYLELDKTNDLSYLVTDFNYSVKIVIYAAELNGTIDTLDSALDTAKSELKTMTQKYSDYSEYPTLKSFYSTVESYAQFVKKPSGSFEQLKTTQADYENDIRTYQSDLSFIFED